MRLFAHFDAPEGDRRRAERRVLRLGIGAAGDWVTVRDISLTGLLLETSSAMAIGARFELELPRTGPTAAVVVWSSGTFYGCEFDQPISQAALSAAVLQSPYAATGDLSPAARDAAAELRRLNSEMDRIAERLDRTIERLRGK